MQSSVTELPFNSFLGIQIAAEPGKLLRLPAGGQYLNHVGAVHASAQLALAEASSGEYLLRALGSAAGVIPVVRPLESKFRKPAKGAITSSASTPPGAMEQLSADLVARGRATIAVAVELYDESGARTLSATVEWFMTRIPHAPEALIQRQLDAYNAHDLDALMSTYAEDAQLFEHPATLLASGAAQLRERFALRFQEPNLQARLCKRIVMGEFVVDHERVTRTFPEGPGVIELIATYEVRGEKIVKAWFLSGAKTLDANITIKPSVPVDWSLTTVPDTSAPGCDLVCQWLREHNCAVNPDFMQQLQNPDNAARSLVLLATADSHVVGGLFAETQFAWLRISIMAVSPEHRSRGIGAALLAEAERQAMARGCEYAFVDTMEYQAPRFYLAHGFAIVGEIPDWDSRGHRKFYFSKKLDESPQNAIHRSEN